MGATNVPTTTLGSGLTMPYLGLGTWTMTDADAADTMPVAAGLGYRMIDTAALYQNERGVGQGVRGAGTPREEFFIVSKVRGRDHGYDRTLKAFDETLDRLDMDYLDLYLIHWPMPGRGLYVETWKALVRILRDGRTKAIGVSNFTPTYIDRIVAETGVGPAVNQIQLNPRVTQRASRAYAAEHGIALQTWRPLGQGDLLAERVVQDSAERHRKTPAQIVLRWHLEHGLSPLPKSVRPDRLAANIDVFDFSLTPAEIDAISGLDGTEIADDPATTEVD
nr:aldo/keto reductase [Dactylosporangium thailandense]